MIGRGHFFGLLCCGALASGVAEAADPRVIDIRDSQSCTEASMPGARCLPVSNFRDGDGKTIGFHALRWLLGTVGLSGEETVLVIGASAGDVRMVGGLMHRAGQHRVQIQERKSRNDARQALEAGHCHAAARAGVNGTDAGERFEDVEGVARLEKREETVRVVACQRLT